MLKSIAAKAPDGKPCCEWIGTGGAGHFVKMVHNGIEYGDMQVIAEAYDLMRRGMGMSPAEMSKVFARWDEGRLRSYLIEITSDILATELERSADRRLDPRRRRAEGHREVDGHLFVRPGPTDDSGSGGGLRPDRQLRSRCAERAAAIYPSGPGTLGEMTPDDVESALYASKIISYAQGFRLMRSASDEFGWDLDLATIASIWRAGCIIRAVFLEDITAAFLRDPALPDMIEDDFFSGALDEVEASWRGVVAGAALSGIPAPAYSSALSYFDGMRSERLPANLIQAQRDFFGAHTFERVDSPRSEFFHHEW